MLFFLSLLFYIEINFLGEVFILGFVYINIIMFEKLNFFFVYLVNINEDRFKNRKMDF